MALATQLALPIRSYSPVAGAVISVGLVALHIDASPVELANAMTVGALTEEASKLSFNERWQLIEALMELGADEEADVTLTPTQREDLRRRMAEARSGKEQNIPGDVAMEMIRKRLNA